MFITFEGPDGCGKTTQLKLLSDILIQRGYHIKVTREPGGTSIGEQIRDVLHNPSNKDMAERAEILLYSASRAQLVQQVIRPALDDGAVVLSDRFYDSTFAYQGYGRQLDLEALRQITIFATGGLKPDLTLYFDLSPQEGLKRRQEDTDSEWNRLDAEALDFHQRVYEGYQALLKAEPERWTVIDASGSQEAVHQTVLELVLDHLRKRI